MQELNLEDSLGLSESGRIEDLSYFDIAYGKEIRLLIEGSKSMEVADKKDSEKKQEKAVQKKDKKNRKKHCFSLSDDLSTWVYKVQNTRWNNANKVSKFYKLLI